MLISINVGFLSFVSRATITARSTFRRRFLSLFFFSFFFVHKRRILALPFDKKSAELKTRRERRDLSQTRVYSRNRVNKLVDQTVSTRAYTLCTRRERQNVCAISDFQKLDIENGRNYEEKRKEFPPYIAPEIKFRGIYILT